MTKEAYSLGPVPCHEDCAQLGDPDYGDRALRECRAYIQAIRKVCGVEPENARLRVTRQAHDFGSYYDVAVEFDGNDPAACEYAHKVDENAPATWAEAGMDVPRLPRAVRRRL